MKYFVKIYIEDENGKVLKTHFLRVDKWEVPAGKIEENEDPKSAAYRELLERTGYKMGEADLFEAGSEGDFLIFRGKKSSLVKVAEPGEKGGYITEINWE